MSTHREKIEAQRRVFHDMQDKHLVGPVELSILLRKSDKWDAMQRELKKHHEETARIISRRENRYE